MISLLKVCSYFFTLSSRSVLLVFHSCAQGLFLFFFTLSFTAVLLGLQSLFLFFPNLCLQSCRVNRRCSVGCVFFCSVFFFFWFPWFVNILYIIFSFPLLLYFDKAFVDPSKNEGSALVLLHFCLYLIASFQSGQGFVKKMVPGSPPTDLTPSTHQSGLACLFFYHSLATSCQYFSRKIINLSALELHHT